MDLITQDLVNDTYLKLREAVIVFATENKYGGKNDFEKIKISEDEDLFCNGVTDLLRDLKDLEVNVEEIRSSVINKELFRILYKKYILYRNCTALAWFLDTCDFHVIGIKDNFCQVLFSLV